MKAMKCEMCNSNDIIKQDGFYVCEYCGTKYTIEEAKKLMIEGTVKIDNSQQIANYISLAKASLKSEELKNCLKYCNMALEYDSKNPEALKIKAQYYHAKIYNEEDEINTLKSVSNSSVIDDEKAELLFSYIREYYGAGEGVDWFVSNYCDNEIIDIKNEKMATKLFKHLIRSCMRVILEESPDKTVGEIIKDFDNVPNELIDTFKYKVTADFDHDECDVPDISLMIKVLIKKLKRLDNNYKYTDDEVEIYNGEVKKRVSYLMIYYGKVDEYKIKEYVDDLKKIKFVLGKIKKIDPTYTFSKSLQENIDKLLKTSAEVEAQKNQIENAKRVKSKLGYYVTLLMFGTLISIFVCLFSTNFKGAGICVLLFVVLLVISSRLP